MSEVAVIKSTRRLTYAQAETLRQQWLTRNAGAPLILQPGCEYLPGANGELIDVSGYSEPRGYRRPVPVNAPPLPRQWYPLDVAVTAALFVLIVLLVWLVLR